MNIKTWQEFPFNSGRANQIADAFNSTGSDKASFHRYERVYQHFLPRTADAILEIGLAVRKEHNSISAWHKLFPKANIYGADKYEDRMVAAPNTTTFLVDQESDVSLCKFTDEIKGVKFDMIVDDASHVFEDTQRTFQYLFPFLNPGGVYFIEDIVTHPNIMTENQKPQQLVERIDVWLTHCSASYYIIKSQPENPNRFGSLIACIRKIDKKVDGSPGI